MIDDIARRGCTLLAAALKKSRAKNLSAPTAASFADARPSIQIKAEGKPAKAYLNGKGQLEAAQTDLIIASEKKPPSRNHLVDALEEGASPDTPWTKLRQPWNTVCATANGWLKATVSPIGLGEVHLVINWCSEREVIPPSPPDTLLQSSWESETTRALAAWSKHGRSLPLRQFPGFEKWIHRPTATTPGAYAVKVPPLPFSPLIDQIHYSKNYGLTVIEDDAEILEIETYYNTPGSCFPENGPIFQNRPPILEEKSRNRTIPENSITALMSPCPPWQECQAVLIYTAPRELQSLMGSSASRWLQRQRYLPITAPTMNEAMEKLSRLLGGEAGLTRQKLH